MLNRHDCVWNDINLECISINCNELSYSKRECMVNNHCKWENIGDVMFCYYDVKCGHDINILYDIDGEYTQNIKDSLGILSDIWWNMAIKYNYTVSFGLKISGNIVEYNSIKGIREYMDNMVNKYEYEFEQRNAILKGNDGNTVVNPTKTYIFSKHKCSNIFPNKNVVCFNTREIISIDAIKHTISYKCNVINRPTLIPSIFIGPPTNILNQYNNTYNTTNITESIPRSFDTKTILIWIISLSFIAFLIVLIIYVYNWLTYDPTFNSKSKYQQTRKLIYIYSDILKYIYINTGYI